VPTSSNLAEVLANGNSAGTHDVNMNGNDITGADQITCSQLNYTTLNPPVAGGSQNLSQVLTTGNSAGSTSINMNNNNISGVNNIALTTINGSAYPPSVPTPTIDDVLGAGNTATNKTMIIENSGATITNLLASNQLTITDNTSPSSAFLSTLQQNALTIQVSDGTGNSTASQLNAGGSIISFNNDATGTGNYIQTTLYSQPTQSVLNCYDANHSSYVDCNILANSLLLNGSPVGGGNQDLNSVLSTGNQANNQSIVGVNDLGCNTINGTSYPPPSPNLSSVLSAGNSASGYDILAVNNLQTTYINGLTPTTIGLTWSDFNGTQAQVNLPNNRYEVGSGTATSWLNQSGFFCSSGSNNMTLNDYVLVQQSSGVETIRLDPAGGAPTLRLGQLGSGGASQTEIINYTILQKNQSYGSGYYWEGKLTMEADAGFHIRSWDTNTSTLHPILLECSQLQINGVPLSTLQPPKAQAYGSASWSIGNGSWYNISGSNSFNFTAGTGWSGYKSFQVSFTFNCYTSHENTGVLYLEFRDTNGNLSNTYAIGNSSYPCYNTGGSSWTGSYTQFNFTDTIQLNNTSGSDTFYLDIYLGHNGGTWTGGSLWGLNMIAI
jgi:hypothetical protein